MSGTAPAGAQLHRRELCALVSLLAAATLLLARGLGVPSREFDEGVYLASADLLRRGLGLGDEVFTSQPPLFLTFVDWINWLAGGSVAALRGATLAVALGGAIAGWALVRRIAGRGAGLAAAGLVLLAPGVVDAAAVVSADVPAVALGTAALLAARAARSRPAAGALAGALLASALLVKLLAAPFVVAIAVGALLERPPRRAVAWFATGSLAVVSLVALAYASVLPEIWAGAVVMHLDAREVPAIPMEVPLAPVVLICLAYGGLAAILALGLRDVGRAGLGRWARDRADLIAALAAGLMLVALHRPLLHHHLVVVAWPLALLAASAMPRGVPAARHVAAALAVLLLAPWAVHGRETVEGRDRARLHQAAALVAGSTRSTDAVVSDLPLVPLLAERPASAVTVDPSYVRVSTGSLRRAQIVEAAGHAGAVVTGRSFKSVPGLAGKLRRMFRTARRLPGGINVYTQPVRPEPVAPSSRLRPSGRVVRDGGRR